MVQTGLLNSINVTQVCRDLLRDNAKTKSAAETIRHLDTIETELDTTLTTLLCDATIRDLIHDNYSAQPETVDVKVLVESLLIGKRFSLHTDPKNMPKLNVDRQLLRIIVGNSVSNAAKYGEVGITVALYLCCLLHCVCTGGWPDRHYFENFGFILVAKHHQHAWSRPRGFAFARL